MMSEDVGFCTLRLRNKIGCGALHMPLRNERASLTPKIDLEAVAIAEPNVHTNQPQCLHPDQDVVRMQENFHTLEFQSMWNQAFQFYVRWDILP